MTGSERYVLVNRLTGLFADGARRAHVAQPVLAVFFMFTVLGPASVALAVLVDPKSWNETVVPVGLLSGLIFFLLHFPLETWSVFVLGSEQHEELLRPGEQRSQLAEWMRTRLRIGPQALVSLSAGIATVPIGIIVIHGFGLAIADCVPYLIVLCLTSALGSNNVWWLLCAPAITRRLSRETPLNLDWRAPAATPGIRNLRWLMLRSARRAGIGTLFFASALVFTAIRVPDNVPIQLLAYSGLVFSCLIAFFVGFAPQYWLAESVRRTIAAQVSVLRAALPATLPRGDTFDSDLLLILFLESHPTTAWDVKWVAGLAATTLFGLLPYGILLTS